MNLDWTTLLAALGGGALGAAFGALPAFIFTGFAVIAGVAIAAAGGGSQFLADVPFGPVFGPHISFAGGAAAAGYAAMRGFGFSSTRSVKGPLARSSTTRKPLASSLRAPSNDSSSTRR